MTPLCIPTRGMPIASVPKPLGGVGRGPFANHAVECVWKVEGTFSIPLPEDYDPDAWAGLTVWCEDYNLSMGSVALS